MRRAAAMPASVEHDVAVGAQACPDVLADSRAVCHHDCDFVAMKVSLERAVLAVHAAVALFERWRLVCYLYLHPAVVARGDAGRGGWLGRDSRHS
jgi:hypothetical protein